MNLVTLECPHCRGMVRVDPSAAGQHVACPLCQGTMQVPTAEALAGAAPEPPPPPSTLAPPPTMLPRGMTPVAVELMSVACPSCGGKFQVPPAAAGLALPCPTCRQLVTIPSVASLVPPPLPPQTEAQLPPGPEPSEPIESLLPPGAEDLAVVPSAPVPLPAAPRPVLVTPISAEPLAVKDRPKVLGDGIDRVEVRRLTPEEKARRRAVRNVILFLVGLVALVAFVVYKTRG